MRLLSRFAVCAVILSLMVGCRTPHRASVAKSQPGEMSPKLPNDDGTDDESDLPVRQVSHRATPTDQSVQVSTSDDPFTDMTELPLDLLIAAVQDRNPSMQVAMAVWGATAERYPQAVALDDPMLQSMFAPASFASNNSQPSYYLGVAQRVPWNGKRALKGQMAKWESTAASWDAEEVKLRLAVASRMAFFDYYLVQREFELNDKNVEVMQDFRDTAKTKYEANQVSQQDLSAADLELAKLKQQRLELSQAERTAIARINTLLHRRPDHFLPASPSHLTIESELAPSSELRDLAVHSRPELAALASRIQTEQNAVALACKEYYPDFEFMGRYDTFWTDPQQRPQVGMNMNVPVRRNRLDAAVREAQFRLAKLTAEYAQQVDAVNEEVEIAYAKVDTSAKAAALFEGSILPFAQTNLDAARAAYIAGSIDFLRLLEARRQFIDQQIGYQRTLTEYHRSHADLERSVGTSLSN